MTLSGRQMKKNIGIINNSMNIFVLKLIDFWKFSYFSELQNDRDGLKG